MSNLPNTQFELVEEMCYVIRRKDKPEFIAGIWEASRKEVCEEEFKKWYVHEEK